MAKAIKKTTTVDPTPHDPKTRPVELSTKQSVVLEELKGVCKDIQKASINYNGLMDKATVSIGVLFALSKGDDKYNLALLKMVRAVIRTLVPTMSDGAINQMIEVGRNADFQHLTGIVAPNKNGCLVVRTNVGASIKRMRELRKREPQHGGDHASGWGRNHPDILGRSTSKKASKQSRKRVTKVGQAKIKVSPEAEKIITDLDDAILDTFTKHSVKVVDTKLFKIGLGLLLDKHMVGADTA